MLIIIAIAFAYIAILMFEDIKKININNFVTSDIADILVFLMLLFGVFISIAASIS